jgi:hypothetical protein
MVQGRGGFERIRAFQVAGRMREGPGYHGWVLALHPRQRRH